MRIGGAALATGLVMMAGLAFAQTTPAAESQSAYVTRCKRETVAKWPSARAQAESMCQANWEMIVATGPMADALLSLAPPTGTAYEPTSARARAVGVRWMARASRGHAATGRVGDVSVMLSPPPAQRVELGWFQAGAPIPYMFEEALRVRGVRPAMIGCMAFGPAESTSVYRVAAPGKAPFVLTVARREAALGSQTSTLSIAADFSGQPVTLATLRRDGSEFAASCPS